jgi:hypothetical protein
MPEKSLVDSIRDTFAKMLTTEQAARAIDIAVRHERERCLAIVVAARPWLGGSINDGRGDACDEIETKIREGK